MAYVLYERPLSSRYKSYKAYGPPGIKWSLHFSSVGLPAAINLTEATATNNSVDAEVVHCQLNKYNTVIIFSEGHVISGVLIFTISVCLRHNGSQPSSTYIY